MIRYYPVMRTDRDQHKALSRRHTHKPPFWWQRGTKEVESTSVLPARPATSSILLYHTPPTHSQAWNPCHVHEMYTVRTNTTRQSYAIPSWQPSAPAATTKTGVFLWQHAYLTTTRLKKHVLGRGTKSLLIRTRRWIELGMQHGVGHRNFITYPRIQSAPSQPPSTTTQTNNAKHTSPRSTL